MLVCYVLLDVVVCVASSCHSVFHTCDGNVNDQEAPDWARLEVGLTTLVQTQHLSFYLFRLSVSNSALFLGVWVELSKV